MKRTIIKKSKILTVAILIFSLANSTIGAQSKNELDFLPVVLPFLLDAQGSQISDPETGAPEVVCPDVGDGPTVIAGMSGFDDDVVDLSSTSFINTQARLNSLSGFTRVSGNLIIFIANEPAGLEGLGLGTDFSPLDSLVEVTGSIALQFEDSNRIETLDLFGCLTTVGENLDLGERLITTNTNVKEIVGFENLTRIGGRLEISAHDELETLASFDNLESIDGGLFMFGTPLLKDIPNFGSLASIGAGIFFINAGSFSEINGFPQLMTINGQGSGGRTSVINSNRNLVCDENNVPNAFLPATESVGNLDNCPF